MEKFKIPILLIIFNRPDTTAKVFDVIKKIKPVKLYIAADGPRINKPGEEKLCEATRNIISSIDWPCEVKTKFQEKNLGCKYGPITAIDWLFANEERGIILEDDCLPDESFFPFCENLLDKYQNINEVMHISGNNFQNGILRGDKKSSYYFSKYTHSWGWATWRGSWAMFDNAIKIFDQFDTDDKIKSIPIGKQAQNFWIKNLRHSMRGNDSWDSLWMYTVWLNNGLAILPQTNLVSNIGFGDNATHTKEVNKSSEIKMVPIDIIKHPEVTLQDVEADNYTFLTIFKNSLIKRIVLKIKQIIK